MYYISLSTLSDYTIISISPANSSPSGKKIPFSSVIRNREMYLSLFV